MLQKEVKIYKSLGSLDSHLCKNFPYEFKVLIGCFTFFWLQQNINFVYYGPTSVKMTTKQALWYVGKTEMMILLQVRLIVLIITFLPNLY